MRALTVTRPGESDPFDLVDVAIPEPAPRQVRIKVAASTIQNVDLVVMSGFMHRAGYLAPGAQSGLGFDVAGIVDSVGTGVSGFAVGDRVAANAPPWFTEPHEFGTHADYTVLPSGVIAHVPDGLDLLAAAAIPMNGLTAMQGLGVLAGVAGNRLLITGAAGEVGGYATALAARLDWEVTGLARSDADEAFVRGAGATTFATSLDHLPPFDAVFDAAKLAHRVFPVIRDGGAYIDISGERTPIPTERGIIVHSVEEHPDGEQLADLLGLAADGILTTRVAGSLPLADATQGFAQMRDHRGRGRWILIP